MLSNGHYGNRHHFAARWAAVSRLWIQLLLKTSKIVSGIPFDCLKIASLLKFLTVIVLDIECVVATTTPENTLTGYCWSSGHLATENSNCKPFW